MSKLNVGVIIGRFQVPELHEGHRRLFGEVAAQSDVVVALLGVSPVDGYTAENPLSFNQRRTIVNQSFPNIAVFPLYDQQTNEEWSLQIDRLIGGAYPHDEHLVILFGGRGSFVDSYKGRYPTQQIKFVPPVTDAGTDLRAAIKQANSPDFYAGQIYALQRQFPHAYPTTDIAVVRPVKDHYDEVLLIQRADSGRWCFPGGFVDPTDLSLELAAARELQEETGLTVSRGASRAEISRLGPHQ
jgi:bifunctional NMN adenylyltransferase/nudix hydrolase